MPPVTPAFVKLKQEKCYKFKTHLRNKVRLYVTNENWDQPGDLMDESAS